MTYSAGNLDQRLTLRRRGSGVDVLGQESETWQTLAIVWGRAEPLRGREYFAAAQVQSETAVRFTIRYRTDLATSDHVLWRDQAHDITSIIDPGGRKETLELMCNAGVRDGR